MKEITKVLTFSLVVFALLALTAGSLATATTPAPSQSFYGSLTINDVASPAGTAVKALIDGEDRTYGGSYSTTSAGQYGSSGLGSKFYVEGTYDDVGKPVVFMVEKTPGSGQYAQADQTGTFDPGASTNLDLTATVETECSDGQTRNCPNQDGVCEGSYETCEDGAWQGCDYTAIEGYEDTEISCDGLDNDCDGTTDEGWENLGDFCSDGVGACYAEGIYTCDPYDPYADAVCNAVPGEPAEEVCNGIDDNCNGQTDEDLGTTTCGLGVCEHTINNCMDGETQACNPFEGASAEVCNDSLDNDCDGLVDCADDDCADECASGEGYCIVIDSVRILDSNFTEVTEILPGRMYNVKVTSENVCADPITPMEIVQIMQGSTPQNIGTLTATIGGGEAFTVTVGFTMSVDATPGDEYTAEVFNWNHWIGQGPHQILSNKMNVTFSVGGGV